MSELLTSLSSDNLVLLCVIMGMVALFLAIAISIEIYNSNKKYQKIIEKSKEEKDIKLNIKESPDIKYVDESDVELEKTKAKIELANLREKLKKEEEEKQKLIEMNIELAKQKQEETKVEEVQEEKKEEIEKLETSFEPVVEEATEPIVEVATEPIEVEVLDDDPIEVQETVKEVVEEVTEPHKTISKSDQLDEALKKVRIGNEEKIDKVQEKPKVDTSFIEILDDYVDDEEDAIISYDELKNSQTFGFTDEEMEKYEDEKDAIISIQELEKLYLESQNIDVQVETTPEVEFNIKRVEDLPEIADSNNFQSSPTISPVYGMSKTDQELVLEQTANLEKLNEEIKKTNEFLKTLKDLKKNLE